MRAIHWVQRTALSGAVDLKKMIGPDKHRPGPARARLITEQIPVWAIVEHVGAIATTTDLAAISDETIAQVAADYAVSPEAIIAALLYYQEHRGVIDALLEANAAAIA